MKCKPMIPAILVMILCLCILPACTPVENNTTSEDTPQVITPTPTEKSVGERTKKPVESTEAPEPLDVAPHAPLSVTGPWYVVANEEGLYAFNMDGSGLTLLTRDAVSNFNSLSSGVATTGGRFAFLTERDGYWDLTLHIIDMVNGQDHKTIPLTSEETTLSDNPQDDWDNLELARAIVEVESYAWSHNGEMLAFFAGIEGPTSDLYIYTPAKDSITRLTTGPSQGFRPVWSPDDEYILHTGASGFGTGAGYAIEGVWAARYDASEVISFPLTEYAGDILFFGWKDNDTFLSAYWNPGNGPNHLQFTNIPTGKVETIWEYPFTTAAIGDVSYPRVIISIDDYASTENPDGLLGVYTLDPPDFDPEYLFEGSPGPVSYIGNGSFLVYAAQGTFLIGRFDADYLADMEGNPIFSDEGTLAWYGHDGLFVDVAGQQVQVINEPVVAAVWGANSASILFATQDVLYVATAPDWKPVLVAAAFPTDEIVLVMP
jgi:hypothetical protein